MSASASALPITEQGDKDWNTLGTSLVDHLLAESFCLNHMDKKYGSSPTAEVLAISDTDWQFDYEKDDVVVFRKKNKGSKLACFAGRGLVKAPYSVVGEFMTDPESSFLWDNYLAESKYVKIFAKTQHHTDYLGYQRFSSDHCFSFLQRDILCFVRCENRNGRFVHSAVSVEDADYPPQRFIPRSEIHVGTGFVLEPFRGSTTTSLVTYFGHVDLKGLPLFITNQVMRMYPMSIRVIRRNFENEQSLQHSAATLPPSTSTHTPTLTSSHHQPPSLPYQEDLSLGMFTGRARKN